MSIAMVVMFMIPCGKGEQGEVHNSGHSSNSSIQGPWQQKGFYHICDLWQHKRYFPKQITKNSYLPKNLVCSSVHKYHHPGGPGHSLCGTGKNNLLQHFLETLELLLAGLLIILASSRKLHVACKLAIWD